MFPDYCGIQTEVHPEGALDLPGSIVTIGAFDGVHPGHQSLIRRAVTRARAAQVPSVVWTFDPPPKVFFQGVEQLCSLADKLARIARLGPDYIVVASFTAQYREKTAEDFIATLTRVAPREIHVGEDFRFGRKQTGDTALLARHFNVMLCDPIRCAAKQTVSSSRIRRLRAEGQHDEADRLHGNPAMHDLLAGHIMLDQSALTGGYDDGSHH